jgi:hypothetical protein
MTTGWRSAIGAPTRRAEPTRRAVPGPGDARADTLSVARRKEHRAELEGLARLSAARTCRGSLMRCNSARSGAPGRLKRSHRLLADFTCPGTNFAFLCAWRKIERISREAENTAAARHSSTWVSRAERPVRTKTAKRPSVQLTVGSAQRTATAPSRESATVPPRMSTRFLGSMNLILSPFLKAWRADRSR